jgi:hypothetical protein
MAELDKDRVIMFCLGEEFQLLVDDGTGNPRAVTLSKFELSEFVGQILDLIDDGDDDDDEIPGEIVVKEERPARH